jgi:hypothetical protein
MKKTLCYCLLLAILAISDNQAFGQYTWTKYPGNPINLWGAPGAWDESVLVPCVIFNADSGRYEMWYTGSLPHGRIGYAVSSDGITWNKHPDSVLAESSTGWDSLCVCAASVIRESGQYKMWYTGWKNADRSHSAIGYATSPDGINNWTKHPEPVVIEAAYCSVIHLQGQYIMFYCATSASESVTGRALSMDGITWQTDTLNNPVLPVGSPGAWDQNNYLPKVLAIGDTLYLWYTAESVPGSVNSGIGLATSVDSGRTWTKYIGNPILTKQAGSWDSQWIETGSIVFKDNTFRMWYDGAQPPSYLGRIGHATAPVTGIADYEIEVPQGFTLKQNYPNPFNPSTTISYQLPVTNYVNLSIYNLLGQRVTTLVNEKLNAGSHTASWNAAGFASGVYLYRLQAGTYSETKKLILLK